MLHMLIRNTMLCNRPLLSEGVLHAELQQKSPQCIGEVSIFLLKEGSKNKRAKKNTFPQSRLGTTTVTPHKERLCYLTGKLCFCAVSNKRQVLLLKQKKKKPTQTQTNNSQQQRIQIFKRINQIDFITIKISFLSFSCRGLCITNNKQGTMPSYLLTLGKKQVNNCRIVH